MATLSAKQRSFVEHYLATWNATEAAKRAGYSEKTAYSIGWENLRKPEIAAAIEARMQDLKATTNEVFARLTAHSRGNIDNFLNSMGLIDVVKARAVGAMPLVKKIKQRTTTVSKKDGEEWETHEIELELYDAQAATVQLGKLLGMFVERHEVYDTTQARADAAALGIDYDKTVSNFEHALKTGQVIDAPYRHSDAE